MANNEENQNPLQKIGSGISNFFQELDNFVDDATSRRLGAGQAFYGKRKSSFYGSDDEGKKKDPTKFDPSGTSVTSCCIVLRHELCLWESVFIGLCLLMFSFSWWVCWLVDYLQ